MSGERTEKPTARRLKDLRRKGTAARSAELPAVASLVAVAVTLPPAFRHLWTSLQTTMTVSLATAGDSDLAAARRGIGDALRSALTSLAPMLAVVGVTGALAGVLVTRQRPNPQLLRPKFDRLNPKNGVRRLAGVQNLVELVRVVAKLGVVALVAWPGLRSAWRALQRANRPVTDLGALTGQQAMSLLLRIALLVVAVGIFDAWWARHRYAKQSKMSKQEVREDHKTTEGNPQVKGAIRARQRAMSRSRMIVAVRKADVVLANPTHIAVALVYERGSAAPIIVAKGAGVIAQRIKAEARAHDVPVVEDRPLARTLWRSCEVGDVIPAELYQAVARVLATVYAARRGAGLRATA